MLVKKMLFGGSEKELGMVLEYFQALENENKQFQLERHLLQKEIFGEKQKFQNCMRERDYIQSKLHQLSQILQVRDRQNQQLVKNQFETEKIIYNQIQQIKLLNRVIEDLKAQLNANKQRQTVMMNSTDFQRNINKVIQDNWLQKKERNLIIKLPPIKLNFRRKSKLGIYSTFNYVEQSIFNKKQKQTEQEAQNAARVSLVMKTIQSQKLFIVECLEKLSELTIQLKDKQNLINKLQNSNTYLRNLNSSFLERQCSKRTFSRKSRKQKTTNAEDRDLDGLSPNPTSQVPQRRMMRNSKSASVINMSINHK